MLAVNQTTLHKKAIKGIGWSLASKFFRQFIQLFFQITLARLMSPEDFGLFSMIIVFINLAEVLRTMGFASALIQKKEIDDNYLNTVFWLNIVIASIIYLIFLLIAPLIASFYDAPQLTKIVRVYSIIFLIGSINVVQEALLQKKFMFKRLFFMDSVSVFVAGVTAVVFALNNFGVWTLVFQYLILSFVSTCILWATSSWKPKFVFSWSAFNDLRKFSFNMAGTDLFNLVGRNIDNLVIGRFLGASALGIYSRAYFFMLQPLNLTHQVLARVMFPLLSTYQDDHLKMKKVYLLSTKLFAFVIFPAFAFIIIAAEPLILLLLGSKWIGVALLLKIFCVYSMVDTIGLTTIWLYKATGETKTLLRWTIYNTTIIIISVIAGLHWGIYGIAWGYTIGFLLFSWIPGWILAFRVINLSLKEMFNNIGGSFLCSLFVYGILFLSYPSLETRTTDLMLCVVLLAESIIIYYGFSILLNKKTLNLFRLKVVSEILSKH